MKHLKYINEKFDKKEYYTNIDLNTYLGLKHKTISMTDRNIETITKDLKYDFEVVRIIWDEEDQVDRDNPDQFKALLIYPDPRNKSISILITQLDDDWFLLDINFQGFSRQDINWGPFTRTYYKCDQIEGVLELLKDVDYLK